MNKDSLSFASKVFYRAVPGPEQLLCYQLPNHGYKFVMCIVRHVDMNVDTAWTVLYVLKTLFLKF